MHPPGYAADQSDDDLDIVLAASGDRLIAAIHDSLDLDAGLAKIIGAPPWEKSTGAAEKISVEDGYLSGPGKAFYLRLTRLQKELATKFHRADVARRAEELTEDQKRKAPRQKSFRAHAAAHPGSGPGRRRHGLPGDKGPGKPAKCSPLSSPA